MRVLGHLLVACCSSGQSINIEENSDGSCSVQNLNTGEDQPCTSSLFGRTCTSINCQVSIYFYPPSGGYSVQPNVQQHLDILGIGSAQYISSLIIHGYWPYIPGIPLNASFFTSLKWVSYLQRYLLPGLCVWSRKRY